MRSRALRQVFSQAERISLFAARALTALAVCLDEVNASPHLTGMFSVEVISSTDDGELSSERTNIPCASSCEEAKRIVRAWLAARCTILQRATLAKLFDGDTEITSLNLDDYRG